MSNTSRADIGTVLANKYAEVLDVPEPATEKERELAAVGAMSALMHLVTTVNDDGPDAAVQLAKESWMSQDPETAVRLGLISWVSTQ